jgi:dGTP triphosphohydrolase
MSLLATRAAAGLMGDSWSQRHGDARSPFDVDYARIVHSSSFRRLQGKTQILNLGDSDFYRTRLKRFPKRLTRGFPRSHEYDSRFVL